MSFVIRSYGFLARCAARECRVWFFGDKYTVLTFFRLASLRRLPLEGVPEVRAVLIDEHSKACAFIQFYAASLPRRWRGTGWQIRWLCSGLLEA